MTYYQRIIQQCNRKGVTEQELCEKLGISKHQLHALNRGFILGKPDILDKVAEVLDIDPGVLEVDLYYRTK